jgi:hypothetical protein
MVQVKNQWSCSPTSLYAFMKWVGTALSYSFLGERERERERAAFFVVGETDFNSR